MRSLLVSSYCPISLSCSYSSLFSILFTIYSMCRTGFRLDFVTFLFWQFQGNERFLAQIFVVFHPFFLSLWLLVLQFQEPILSMHLVWVNVTTKKCIILKLSALRTITIQNGHQMLKPIAKSGIAWGIACVLLAIVSLLHWLPPLKSWGSKRKRQDWD